MCFSLAVITITTHSYTIPPCCRQHHNFHLSELYSLIDSLCRVIDSDDVGNNMGDNDMSDSDMGYSDEGDSTYEIDKTLR